MSVTTQTDAASRSNDTPQAELDQRAIDTIRFLAVDAVQQANSGHPGLPMGAAPMAYVLWTRFLRHNPKDPGWFNRDRFVLSAGHGSMLLYAMLHLTGYDLPLEELKNFRQWGSKTPGHPENGLTPGVETTTGPLGQGFANGIGLAMAERYLAAHFNKPDADIVDHYVYAIVSDGDLMEGVSHEAASLAGHLGLGNLIYLYDDNNISIDGKTELSFTEDVGKRFEAYHWHVQHVDDGNDLDAIAAAIKQAQAETDRPSIIAVRTIIGYGSPNKAGTSGVHGSPLGAEEVTLTKRNLGWPEDQFFYIPDDVRAHMQKAVSRGARYQAEWNDRLSSYREAHPEEAQQFDAWTNGGLPEGWEAVLPTYEAGGKMATRAASGKALDALVPAIGNLVGGSADLTPSNKTRVKVHEDFQKDNPAGSYFRFGVREHAMAAICNGLALHSGLRPFCGTFLVFSDYMRPAIRLSAIMHVPVVYVFTHDSIGVGEDGPTHQAVEHYMALRAIPNLTFIRPADANETSAAWAAALRRTTGPTALALTRQGLLTQAWSGLSPAEGVHKGAYILSDSDGAPDLILMASGSEVELIVGAADVLRGEGVQVRVVSMPSWELFDAQPESYRNKVLPPDVRKRVAVEAGVTLGWEKYVGLDGTVVGLDRFGASAPYATVYEKLGLTVEDVARQARTLLGK